MMKIFSENSFYNPWPYNKSNTQTIATPVSLNLFTYTDNSQYPIFLQSSIKSNISGKRNIIKVRISKQYHVLFIT